MRSVQVTSLRKLLSYPVGHSSFTSVNLFSFAFLEGKAFRHGDIVSVSPSSVNIVFTSNVNRKILLAN
jgi:hypothetical protein